MNEKVTNYNNVDPLRIIQWVIDRAIERTQVLVRGLMYSENLLPEEMEKLHILKITEKAMQAKTKNISELYAGDDAISSVKMNSYSASEYLSSVVKQIMDMVPENSFIVELECDEGCKSVLFDLRRMGIIIYNLISNSIIHNKKKDKIIKINAFVRGSDFVIRISDNGKSIPEGKRNLLFLEDGIMVDVRSENPFGIKGLGLMVCRKVAREMDGDVVYIPSSRCNVFEVVVSQRSRGERVYETAMPVVSYEDTELYMADAILSLMK